MSAALLRDIRKPNELEDDRGSCLYVLIWMALHFTNHTISRRISLDYILGSFDDAYEVEGGVNGGQYKRWLLLTRDIPHEVKFDDRPQLDKLIEELTDTFAVRYDRPPSAEDISSSEAYHQHLRDIGYTDEKIAKTSFVFHHARRMASLKSPDWLVKTFRHHLEAGPWPLSDKAVEQTGSSKRKGTGTGQVGVAGKVRKLHSGSREPSQE
jgi:hypothetical protein